MSTTQATTVLEDMRTLLYGSARVLRQVQADHEHRPTPGSQTRREIDEERVRDAYSAAGLKLGVAIDHLVGLADLLTPTAPHPYAPASLARSSIECSARAWWLLDPKLTVKQRIARGFTERLESTRNVLI